jgi:signal peptidase II
MKPSAPRRLSWLLSLSAFVFLLDRIAKTWVVAHLRVGEAISVAPHLPRIIHSANNGGNFGFFAGAAQESQSVHWVLTGINGLIPLVLLFVMARFSNHLTGRALIGLAMAMGGTLGNFCDRLLYGSVVDFIEVRIFSYHWPEFNLADIGYVTAFSLLLLDSLLRWRASSRQNVFASKRIRPKSQERAT